MYAFVNKNQLVHVNIHSSVGMFTMSCQSLTYAEPLCFLVLQHNFCQIIFIFCLSDFMCKFYFFSVFCDCLLFYLVNVALYPCIILTLDLIVASVCS